MIEHHSPIGVAAYQDLLRLLEEESVSDVRGKPWRKQVGQKGYWYDRYRIGDAVKDRYLGEDTPALRARLERHEALAADRRRNALERSRLARVLQAERYRTTDGATGKILAAFAKAGVFRLGGTLVGTHAFRCYEAVLGCRMRFDETASTNDLDIASFERLSLALDDMAEPPLARIFAEMKFEQAPSLDGRSSWRWRQAERGTLVEFLTPSFDERETVRTLKALGVKAQSLHFLNYLIKEPIRAAVLYRQGILVQIPQPERFAIHKMIVADRRRDGPDSLKARKDRAQAAWLVEVLAEERPHDLAAARDEAMAAGEAWRIRLAATLEHLPRTREILAGLPS